MKDREREGRCLDSNFEFLEILFLMMLMIVMITIIKEIIFKYNHTLKGNNFKDINKMTKLSYFYNIQITSV
jgi:hypothetical protein